MRATVSRAGSTVISRNTVWSPSAPASVAARRMFALVSGQASWHMVRNRCHHHLRGQREPAPVLVNQPRARSGGYVVMAGGRTFHPELVLVWPWAETAVMAIETAVELVHRKEIEDADDPGAHRGLLVDRYRSQIDAIRGAEAFGFDAIVRPARLGP